MKLKYISLLLGISILTLFSFTGCTDQKQLTAYTSENDLLPQIIISENNLDNIEGNKENKTEVTLSQNISEDTSENVSLNKSKNISENTPNNVSLDASDPDSSNDNANINELITYKQGFTSQMIPESVKKRIYGLSYKTNCTIPYEDLRYLNVLYYDFNGKICSGEIICNQIIANDLLEIFYGLYEAAYPIQSIRLVDEYQADDDLSCLANNTSAFNFRTVDGSKKLSKHAQGLAIDINPLYNPYVKFKDGIPYTKLEPSNPYIDRTINFPYKIDTNDLCYQLFSAHGFTWGGNWNSIKDYQHFEK